MMRILGFIIFLIIVLIGVSFAMLNSQTVHFNYYVGERNMALSLLLAAALLVGVVLGWLVMLSRVFSLRFTLRRTRKQLHLAEKEIKNLRHAPIKDEI